MLEYSWLVLKQGIIDLDLQDHFGHFDSKFYEVWLVRVVTCDGLELESPSLNQVCILGLPQLAMNMGVIDVDLQDHLTISTQNSKKRCSAAPLYTDRG